MPPALSLPPPLVDFCAAPEQPPLDAELDACPLSMDACGQRELEMPRLLFEFVACNGAVGLV